MEVNSQTVFMTKIKVAILLVSPGKAGVESVVGNILRYIDKEKVELYLISSSEIAPYYVGLVPEERVLVLGVDRQHKVDISVT